MHARAIVLNDVMMQTDATRKPEAVQRRRLNGRPAWLLNTRNTSVVLCLGLHDTLLLPYWGANGQTDVPGDYVGGARAEKRGEPIGGADLYRWAAAGISGAWGRGVY
jgi:hypothetical protein